MASKTRKRRERASWTRFAALSCASMGIADGAAEKECARAVLDYVNAHADAVFHRLTSAIPLAPISHIVKPFKTTSSICSDHRRTWYLVMLKDADTVHYLKLKRVSPGTWWEFSYAMIKDGCLEELDDTEEYGGAFSEEW